MKKIKEFFAKIFSCIGNFFRSIKKAIGNFIAKVCETKFMRKVIYVLGYVPNAIASRLKNNTRKAIWGVIFIIPLVIGLMFPVIPYNN